MKNAKMTLQMNVVVQESNRKNKNSKWAQIKCKKTGKILHTGSPTYIKQVLKKRLSEFVDLS